jgi:hypothetical protein
MTAMFAFSTVWKIEAAKERKDSNAAKTFYSARKNEFFRSLLLIQAKDIFVRQISNRRQSKKVFFIGSKTTFTHLQIGLILEVFKSTFYSRHQREADCLDFRYFRFQIIAFYWIRKRFL